MDYGMILRGHMAPRGCFLYVAKSSECDLFSGALVVRKSSLNLPGVIWDHPGSFLIFSKFSINLSSWTSVSPPFPSAELLLRRMELELIFYETLMYFGHKYSPVWSEDP